MSGGNAFFDTHVLVHLLSADAAKADRAEGLVAAGGTVSVQVLNEFVAVATRKLRLSLAEIREVLTPVRQVCVVQPMTVDIHDQALTLAERHGWSIHDSLIVSAALLAGCTTLYTEDLQHGQVVDQRLTVRNAFAVP